MIESPLYRVGNILGHQVKLSKRTFHHMNDPFVRHVDGCPQTCSLGNFLAALEQPRRKIGGPTTFVAPTTRQHHIIEILPTTTSWNQMLPGDRSLGPTFHEIGRNHHLGTTMKTPPIL